ncbi:hypothetical protein [Streptomyces tritici]|uniref:hypothetical protein n=1 Tax=Streptomyces tritici TaxID=2054410 RepID=UPI003AF13F5C
MVTVVLVVFIVLSVLLFVFSLLWMQGERENLKTMTELCEIGVETQAHLTYKEPLRGTTTLRVRYTFRAPNGDKGEYQTGVGNSPVHVLGDTYPLVHHPRLLSRVHLGTMKTVRKERRTRASYVRTAQRLALLSLTACGLAVAGLVLSP